MYRDTYNSTSHLSSAQKRPLTSTQPQHQLYRPSSSLGFKQDTELTYSPSWSDSKTLKNPPASRYEGVSSSIRPYEAGSHGYQSKDDDRSYGSHLSRNNNYWAQNISLETADRLGDYSTSNLRGSTGPNHHSSYPLFKSPLSTGAPYVSRSGMYEQEAPRKSSSNYPARDATPTRDLTPTRKEPISRSSPNSKEYAVTTSSPTHKKTESFEPSSRHGYGIYSSTPTQVNKSSVQYQEQNVQIPPFEPTKCSIKANGLIKAYAANTHQGIVRNYNEDRVAILANIMKPPNVTEEWPLCSFFGVYDGHGGQTCADFLRDNLHQYVIQNKNFPKNPMEALRQGFNEAERVFLEMAQQKAEVDRSGSCAIVALIVDDMCYIANVGDSRAVASFDQGRKITGLSRDHKPNDKDETKRIVDYGGKIYQSQATQPPGYPGPRVIYGPHRVFPGRLSVSRTFGDIEAKHPKFGGNPNVVIAEPEIKAYKINKDWDFVVLASDGIFDKMENNNVVDCIWASTVIKENNIHKQSAAAAEALMKESLRQKTSDNITVIMISFEGFEKKNFGSDKKEEVNRSKVEQSPASPQKSFLDNSTYEQSGGRPYLPVTGHRSYINNSTSPKKYDPMGSKPFEYTTSIMNSFERQNRSFLESKQQTSKYF